MAEVAVVEAPGGIGDVYQCPNCSLSYLSWDKEEGPRHSPEGQLLNRIKPPKNCKRCGSPMDVNEALNFKGDKSFGDVQAELVAEDAKNPTAGRRTLKV